MKKLLMTIAAAAMLVSAGAFANDETLMFEIGIGFGNASGGKTDGNDNAKFCKNRNTGRMVFGAVRYTNDDVELHVARWFHDEDVANCDRDSWAVGLGYVVDTQGDGDQGVDDVYASWTPGFAYMWGKDKGFTGEDRTNTNWRNTSNWQVFNRFAVGAGGSDGSVELAVHRYGTWNPEHGEYFATIGGQLRDLDGAPANNGSGDRDIGGGDTYITNVYEEYITYEGDTIDNSITVIENNGGDGAGGPLGDTSGNLAP